MNKLIFNYKAFCVPGKSTTRTVDGKTFDCLVDKGWFEYQHRRFQLHGVDLPDTTTPAERLPLDEVERAGGAEEAKRLRRQKFGRARDCLTLALLGERPLSPEPLPGDFKGRSCILAPLKPNSYLRSVVRLYLQTARNNVLHQVMSFQVASHSFLDVNKFMFHMGGLGYDLDRAREILDSFEIMDVTIG